MKHIPLKTLPDRYLSGPDIEYAQVLREVVGRPLNAQQGVGIAEMRQSLRMLDAIDAANGTLELEDEDYALLLEKLLAMSWNRVDKRIIQMIDDVSLATSN